MFMIASEYDPVVPRHQLDDMLCALESKGISRSLYQVMLLSLQRPAFFQLLAKLRSIASRRQLMQRGPG